MQIYRCDGVRRLLNITHQLGHTSSGDPDYWTLPTSRGHHPGRSYCLRGNFFWSKMGQKSEKKKTPKTICKYIAVMEYVDYWTLPTSRGHHPGRSYCLEKSKKNDRKIFRKQPENPTHEHRRDGVRQLLNITHQLQPLPRQKWVSPSKKKKSTLKKTHYPPASSKFPKIALFFCYPPVRTSSSGDR
jgi:hypothetical protein